MVFCWDQNKSRTNSVKHGVSFDVAVRVFDDPHALSVQDRVVDGEIRWQTLGLIEGVVVLLVAHASDGGQAADDGEETVRIISARRATAHERRMYERTRKGDAG